MTAELDPRSRWRPSRLLAGYAHLLVGLRWIIVVFWIVAAGAVLSIPAIGNSGQDLSQLVSADNPAVQSEVRSADKFGFPLLSRVAIVQYDARGLPADVQARAVTRARELTPNGTPASGSIIAAVPVVNT